MSSIALDWLPTPPAEWRARLAALSRDKAEDKRAAKALANARLSFTATNALDAACRHLCPAEGRLALLSSSTSAHLAGAIRVAAIRRGFALDLYEPDYGQYRQDLADPSSRLHRFAPTHALFAFDADAVAAHASAEGMLAADRLVEAWRELWRLARRGGAAVLQQTVMPRLPAAGGSNDHRLPASGAAFVARVNTRLREVADAEGVDLVALDGCVAAHGVEAWFNPAAWYAAKQEVALPAAPFYGELVARVIAARRGLGAKCCVFDLDNTLWGGVVGDDGVGGLVLGQGSAAGEAYLSLHRFALELKGRGILLAVASKNDDAVARSAFERHPESLLRLDDFSCFVANWADKASNLRRIAGALNIGLDALVFVDDNPYERDQVRSALPEVFVPELPDDPALVPRRLAEAGCFEVVRLTGEDAARAALYRVEAERRAALDAALDAARDDAGDQAGDLQLYLAGLGMVLEHAPVSADDVARVTQLINKTNQFNLATRRLGEDAVRRIAGDPQRLALRFRLVDRFGDSGTIAVVTGRIEGGSFVVDDWLMSCRVLGRDVEYATLAAVVERLRRREIATMVATFHPSGRNGMVADLLPRLGFATGTAEDGTVTGHLDLAGFARRPSPVATREMAA